MSPSVLTTVFIPLITAAHATIGFIFLIVDIGSNGANAPEIAPTKHDFAS